MQRTTALYPAQYRALATISLICVTLELAAYVLAYKLVNVGGFTFPGSVFLSSVTFVICDVIAEVYGYQLGKRVIWPMIWCGMLFSLICVTLTHLPSPATWQYQSDYDQILGKQLLQGTLGCLIGSVIGPFLNSYLLVKWKILLHGKYFWVRCTAASMIGQSIHAISTITLGFLGTIPFSSIIGLILTTLPIKIILTSFLSIISSVFVYYLKKLEGVDVYENDIKFNPFALEMKREEASILG